MTMCEITTINNIPVKSFRFKRTNFGYEGTHSYYTIHIERIGDYWWWDVHYKVTIGYQIAESDFAYKTDAKTFNQAKRRAIKALNKWRRENV